MSDMGPLQRMLNRTTLSTQRLLHTHILDRTYGWKFRGPSWSNGFYNCTLGKGTAANPKITLFLTSPEAYYHKPLSTVPILTTISLSLFPSLSIHPFFLSSFFPSLTPFLLTFLLTTIALYFPPFFSPLFPPKCLQVCFKEALLARERLEAEERQGERVEQQAQFEERCVGLRQEIEREMRLAVEETCGRMRAEIQREVEEERRREVEAMEAKVQENVKRLVRETEVCVRQQCEREAQKDLQILQDRHTVELALMQSRQECLHIHTHNVHGTH
ncbi:uncharacterized protein si:dkey-111f13.5 [Salvelinus namaycush]|uniref:Uncharacterized protein si:dkey-111f13.5 n=1 Tax=Salvelinus namaycush TaxID=8040 RepID=A0A8U0PUQ2_SALNM|nr:uncharacterized protein si:dkey-111f13.5 [Salvelinus namaycush]